MAVPESITGAYAAYLAGMENARRSGRSVDGLFGLGRNATAEQCQDAFVASLTSAVDNFAASRPEGQDVCDAVRFILAQAHEHRESRSAYWMLLASHALAIPLVELLSAEQAREIREYFEGEYPRRERLPVQKELLKALKDRAAG